MPNHVARAVLLQPMKEEPPAGTKCRDKFLVQSAIITPDRETRSLQELWATVEAEAKQGKEGAIHEQKIRCAFLPPLDGEGGLPTLSENAEDNTSNHTSGLGGVAAIPAIHSNDTSMDNTTTSSSFSNGNASTPSRFANDGMHTAPSSAFADRSAMNDGSPAMTDAHASPVAPIVEKMQSAGVPTNTAELKSAASNVATTVSNAASSAATTVSNAASNAASSAGLTQASRDQPSSAVPSSYSSGTSSNESNATLSRDLAIARAEIERLKGIIKEKESSEGLRQRNVGGGSTANQSSMAGSQVATVTQEGIPLPMVGAIAAGVFVFTWLFF